ncbi:MAG: hypothetical protein Q8L48_25030 [Archangium sp.]|nr:hypothetical protein [Archangium sp.]
MPLTTAPLRSRSTVSLVGLVLLGGLAWAGPPLSSTERGALQRLSSEAGMAQQILDQNPPEKFTAAHAAFVKEKIRKCEAELPRCPPASHPDTQAAQAKIDTLKADLEARAGEAGKLAPGAKKVTASIQEWVTRLDKEKTDDPLAFNDANGRVPKKLREDLDGLEKKLAKAGNPEHPDAKEAAAALADARQKFDAALAEAKAAVASLGDWKAELVKLAETFDGRATLTRPVNDEKMEGWIASLPGIKANIDGAEAYDQKLRSAVPDYGQSKECRDFNDKLFAEKNTFNQSTSYWENEFVHDINAAERQELIEGDVVGDTFDSIRRFIDDGIHAAKMQVVFYRDFKKSPADVQAAEAKIVELQDKLAKLDAAQDKAIDKVRMPKDRGNAEMKKLAATVTGGGDFTRELKGEGRKLLRLVVVDSAITHNNSTEWNGGAWLKRDYDTFEVVGAFKDKTGRVDQLSFTIRFARSDVAAAKKGVWTYGSWRRRGSIREANVFK